MGHEFFEYVLKQTQVSKQVGSFGRHLLTV
jgi:hypothetical protein